MKLDAYLDRIGFTGPRSADEATLADVVRCHATAISFENLAVLASGPPDLEVAAIEAKLVERRRGGYCYEQNTLLAAALSDLGFTVLPLSARVRYGVPANVLTARTHMVLCAHLADRRMLVDVGFGSLTPTAPLDIDSTASQPTAHEVFRCVPCADGYLLQACVGGESRDIYSFDFTPQHPVDFVQQNWFVATRPNALFANNVVAARPVENGRYTLFNRTLAFRTPQGAVRRESLDSFGSFRATLESTFGIQPAQEELEKAWDVSGRGQPSSPTFS